MSEHGDSTGTQLETRNFNLWIAQTLKFSYVRPNFKNNHLNKNKLR